MKSLCGIFILFGFYALANGQAMCTFRESGTDYICELFGGIVTPENKDKPILTEHGPSQKTNDDVNILTTMASGGSPRVISELVLPLIFTAFLNLKKLESPAGVIVQIKPEYFFNCAKLEILILKKNTMATLPANVFQACGALVELDLSENEVETLERTAFLGLGNLKTLKINNNQILQFDSGLLNGLTNLEFLHLHANGLRRINGGSFTALTSLKELNLNNNLLDLLEKSIFESLSKMTTFDVSNSSVDKIRRGFFDTLGALQVVKLSSNKCIDKSYTTFSQSDLGDFEQCFQNAGAAELIFANILLIGVLALRFL